MCLGRKFNYVMIATAAITQVFTAEGDLSYNQAPNLILPFRHFMLRVFPSGNPAVEDGRHEGVP